MRVRTKVRLEKYNGTDRAKWSAQPRQTSFHGRPERIWEYSWQNLPLEVEDESHHKRFAAGDYVIYSAFLRSRI
jgi:hypothetical protein